MYANLELPSCRRNVTSFLFVYANLELPSYRRNVTSFLFPFNNPPYLLLFLWLFPVYLTSYLSNLSIDLFIQLLRSFIIHSAKPLFLHISILYLLPFLGAIFKFNRNYLQIFQHLNALYFFSFKSFNLREKNTL